MADTTPYGDVTYADPGYQADKVKRYPIDTKEHAKAAWSYVNQADNASKYSPADLARVKSRIRAALEKFGVQVSDDTGRSEESSMIAVERRFTAVTVEYRAGGDGTPRIGGYAAKFDKMSKNLGGFVEVVERSFFNKARGDGWPDVVCRYNHDDNMLLGTTGAGTLKLNVDDTGLDYMVNPPNARADVVELVQRGDVRQSSFAFRAHNDDWQLSDQGYPMRHLVTGQLVDVAPVNIPAYSDTSVGMRSMDPAEVRRLGIGPEAAYASLARRMEADPAEVRNLADQNELRRFFIRTDNAGPAKPKMFGPEAALQLLARRQDPWA